MKKKICGIVSVTGLLILFGATGSVEHNNLSLLVGTLAGFLGLAMFAGGAYFGGVMSLGQSKKHHIPKGK